MHSVGGMSQLEHAKIGALFKQLLYTGHTEVRAASQVIKLVKCQYILGPILLSVKFH